MDAPTRDTRNLPSAEHVFLSMRKAGLAGEEVCPLAQGMRNTPGGNARAAIRAEFAKILTQLESQRRQLRSLIWMTGAGFTGLAILITVLFLRI